MSAPKPEQVRPLYLFWGEEFLVRREAEALARTLVPDAAAGLNYAVLDAASPREIAAELIRLEGEETFAGLQRFLATVHRLTSERRLSRFAYLGRKQGE